MSSIRVKITAYVMSIAYSITLAIGGIQLPSTTSKAFSFLPTAIVIGFAIFDQWLWRLSAISKIVHMPNLIGTWRGELVSMHLDDDGNETTHAGFVVVLTIRQTFTSISLTMMTEKSKSRSAAESIVRNANGDYTVYYHYNNVPKLSSRARLQLHAGGAVLEVSDHYPTTLAGEYWTNRKTRGTFKLTKINSNIVGSFDEATSSLSGR
jgi:predicted pore-forming effector associated with SMODS systems